MTGLLWFLIIGAIAGWLAGLLMKGGGYGLLGDIIVGVIGAVL
ncbi:MAG: GlsB/YeaQ/YmgE family stress response membrane protein, partial [bacterium]